MRARAPAGRSVGPRGARGICRAVPGAGYMRPARHSRENPALSAASTAGDRSLLFFPSMPPPREPTPLPHPLPGDSLALVAVSLLPEFRPAAPGGETQSHVSALGTRNMLRVAGGIEVLQPAGQGGAPAWTGRPPPASSLSQPCPAPQSSPDGHHSAFGWVKFSARS